MTGVDYFLSRTCHLAIQKLVSLAYPDTIAHQSLMISPHGDAIPPDPKRRLNSKSYTVRGVWNGVTRSIGFNPDTASIAQLDIPPLLLECQQ